MTKILVVDDEARKLDDIAEELTSDSFQVDKAHSCKEALQLIDNNIYDIIVTDLYMETQSENDGFTVLKYAKDKSKQTHVIVITSWGTPETNTLAMQLGAYDYVERDAPSPFLMRLSESVSKAIDAIGGKSHKSHD